jgi:tetratricopeptide (TPR) repeat protein
MRRQLGKDYAVSFQRLKAPALLAALAGLLAITIVALLLIGSAGRSRVDNRLEETFVRETSLGERVVLWEDSLGMVRDFPVLGVGLGCWSELFPHYHRPPWRSGRFLESHNDYLQLFAETGLVGFALLMWFFFHAVFRPFARIGRLAPAVRATFAALVSGLAVMAVHELFDFNLQIPANAFLFALMLGLANRLALGPDTKKLALPSLRARRFSAAGIGALALVLGLVALEQEKVPYPYNMKDPASLDEARDLLLAHPASSFAHLALVNCCGDAAPDTARLKQLEIALWLDPSNPFARDAYAGVLLREKRIPEALRELTTSVFLAPSIYTHSYLAQRVIPWLSADEQAAVEAGLKRARAFGYSGALEGLANIYASLGRLEERAKLYEDEASKQSDGEARARYLIEAAQAYAQGRRPGRAEALFRQAALAAPSDPRPYHYLAVSIFAPRNDLGSAQAVINQGIDNGADPFVLSLSLAEAAEKVGDLKSAEAALGRAVTLQPASLQTRIRLGLLYLGEGKFDRAALVMRKATDINPFSADAFFNLGRAEEGRYQYFAAGQAYTRALELEPGNAAFQKHYREFRRRLRNDSGA